MQVTHSYWCSVEAEWAGFSAEKEVFIPGFEKAVTIFLGNEFDDEGEEIETPPPTSELDAYAQTFQQLLMQWDAALAAIKESAFSRYQRLYAHYYEHEEASGERPLGIDTAEKHFEQMRDLNCIRISEGGTVRLIIHYALDTEHGLEIKLVAGEVEDIAGIAET